MRIKKELTAKSLLANRNNSKKSTGPQTPNGKRNSSQNSLKWGLFSRELCRDEAERQEQQQLRTELRNELDPSGTLQEIFFDDLITAVLQYKRLLKWEDAELRRRFEPDASATGRAFGGERTGGLYDAKKLELQRALRSLEKIGPQATFISPEQREELAANVSPEFADIVSAWTPSDPLAISLASSLVGKAAMYSLIPPEEIPPPTPEMRERDARIQKVTEDHLRAQMMHKLVCLQYVHIKEMLERLNQEISSLERKDPLELSLRYRLAIRRQLCDSLNRLLDLKRLREPLGAQQGNKSV